jgi:hypothetical protein
MPGPGPHALRSADAANAANRECEGCHADVAATWRASLHAQAYSDPLFRRAFAEEPARFCHDCHAPEPNEAMGVACITCHDPNGTGEVLGAPRPTPPRAPHRVRREQAFAGTAACAGCHEFRFPDADAGADTNEKMQRTVSEHAKSRFADRPCSSCHMPVAGETRSHRFAPDIHAAMSARAERHADRLAVHLVPRAIGHAFPTGDLFRRVLVVAEVVDDDWLLLARAEKSLARHFRFDAGVQREVSDDRLSSETTIELDLGPRARGHDIVWRVEYQRIATMHGDQADVASREIIAEGRSKEMP